MEISLTESSVKMVCSSNQTHADANAVSLQETINKTTVNIKYTHDKIAEVKRIIKTKLQHKRLGELRAAVLTHSVLVSI